MKDRQVMFLDGLPFGWVVNDSTLNEIYADKIKRQMLIDALFDKIFPLDEERNLDG